MLIPYDPTIEYETDLDRRTSEKVNDAFKWTLKTICYYHLIDFATETIVTVYHAIKLDWNWIQYFSCKNYHYISISRSTISE